LRSIANHIKAHEPDRYEVNMARVKPSTAQLAPFNLPRADADALKALSQRTRVPQAAYLREAIADLLNKYREESGHEAR
jgi:hypothetical protein